MWPCRQSKAIGRIEDLYMHFLVKSGYGYVVDLDLEAFFDWDHHGRRMSRLVERIEDKQVLKLVCTYLRAGILENGLVKVPTEGTLQGGPLPVLVERGSG